MRMRYTFTLLLAMVLSAANAFAQEPPIFGRPSFQNNQPLLEPSKNVARDILATRPNVGLDKALVQLEEDPRQPQTVEAARSVLWNSLDRNAKVKAIAVLDAQDSSIADQVIWS